MPEILTESFCERCGTRYTFESAAPRAARLKGIKVISRGLKNFVMSDDTSMDEAMAAARSETDREVTTQQLDAFHKTFNFCMSCRQYTCGNCWNEADGQCLSCSPHLGHEIMPAPFPDLDPTAGIALTGATNGANGSNGHAPDDAMPSMAWPTSDLMRDAEAQEAVEAVADLEPPEPIDAAARLAALGAIDAAGPAPEATAAPAIEDTLVAEPAEVAEEPAIDIAAATGAVVEPEAAETVPGIAAVDAEDHDGRAAAAAGRTSALFHRFRPGQSLDEEIAAFEREQAAADAGAAVAGATVADAAAAAADDVPAEPVVAVEPEPVAPEPEPVAAEPIAADLPTPRVDVVPQPTWQIVAPEAPTDGIPSPAVAPTPAAPAPVPDAEPQWPVRPEWPSHRPAAGLPFLDRPATSTGGLESLWAESAREVTAATPMLPAAAARPAGGVAPCVSCGLSLSATARFCRRCGTRQG